MNIINTLLKKAQEQMHLQLILTNGSIIEGVIEQIDNDSAILQNQNGSSAAYLSAVIAWNLNPIAHSNCIISNEELPVKNIPLPNIMDNSSNILSDFSPERAEFKPITSKPHVNKTPDILNFPENRDDKKKWDSIISRYQNVTQNDDLTIIGDLVNELLILTDKYPEYPVFPYNIACFKLKECNYPDAGNFFVRALSIDKNPDYAYNAACAYLLGGDKQKAHTCLGTFFCLAGKIDDENMWLRLCYMSKELQEHQTSIITFRELIGQHPDLNSERKEILHLLLKSALYILQGIPEMKELIINFYNYTLEGDLTIFDEMLDKFLEKFDCLVDTHGLLKDATNSDSIYNLLNESTADHNIDLQDKRDYQDKYSEDFETTSLPIPAASNKVLLKKGTIYRTIPPNKFGFLWDEKALSCHFKYDVIYDNIGYLDSITMDNTHEVFYLSKPSDIPNASTKETATFICSHQFLSNMIDLAKNFSKERDYPTALLELNNVLAYDPHNKEAQELKKRWAKLYDERYKKQADRFSFQPETPAEWETKGNVLLELGMMEEATEAFSRASPGTTSTSNSLYGKGISCILKKEYDEALEYFEKALTKNPLHYYAIFAQGETYNRKGEYDKSIECFKDVLSLRPDYTYALKAMAFALFRLQKYEKSLQAYDMILTFEPENWLEMSKKSSVLIKMKRTDLAMKCIETVLEHNPTDPRYLFVKGYIYQVQEKYSDALRYFDMSLDNDPKNVKALSKKAYVLAILSRNEEALESIGKAMDLNIHNPKTWYYKGVIYHYAEDYEKAILAYNKSLEIYPDVTRVIICRERALQKLAPQVEDIPEICAENEEKIEDLIKDLQQKFTV